MEGIIGVPEAVQSFQAIYPQSGLSKLQIEPEGTYLKYEMVRNDTEYKNTLEINAHTASILKEKRKLLKEKYKDPVRRERKALNLEGLIPLSEINEIAREQVDSGEAFQWELDRAKEWTVWKIEFADDMGEQITEIKVDAQEGIVVQMKLKS